MRSALRKAGLISLLLAGPTAFAADRVLGGTIDLSMRPDYLTSGAGENDSFVFATSTSSYLLSVVELSLNEDIGPYDPSGLITERSRGITASPVAGVANGIVAIAANDGWIDFWYLEDIEASAQDGTVPLSDFMKGDADGESLGGLAIDQASTRTFAGVPADISTGINTIAFSSPTGPEQVVVLGKAPLTAIDFNTGFLERIWYGCDDGFLAWVDVNTLTPGVSAAPLGTAGDRLTSLAIADFGGGALRLLVVNETNDTLYVVDPATASAVDSAALGADLVAVAASGSGATGRIWVALTGAGGNRIEGLDITLAEVQPDVALPAAPISLTERDGRLFAGMANSDLAVVTDLPYVEITALAPESLTVASSDVVVTFVSSQSGNARLYVNGTQLETTSVTAAVPASVTLSGADLEDLVDLGRNRVRVEVTAAALVGHDEAILGLDEAPGAPRNFEVGFGNGRVIGRWDSPAGANDIDYYLVYFGLSASGSGGTATQTSPAEVEGGEYIVDVSNGTTVYMSVAAMDSGGNLSAPTQIRNATAQQTVGAADLAGDDGGFLCSVSSVERRAGPFALAIAAGLLALMLRRGSRRVR